jgi:hypothetical protein
MNTKLIIILLFSIISCSSPKATSNQYPIGYLTRYMLSSTDLNLKQDSIGKPINIFVLNNKDKVIKEFRFNYSSFENDAKLKSIDTIEYLYNNFDSLWMKKKSNGKIEYEAFFNNDNKPLKELSFTNINGFDMGSGEVNHIYLDSNLHIQTIHLIQKDSSKILADSSIQVENRMIKKYEYYTREEVLTTYKYNKFNQLIKAYRTEIRDGILDTTNIFSYEYDDKGKLVRSEDDYSIQPSEDIYYYENNKLKQTIHKSYMEHNNFLIKTDYIYSKEFPKIKN